MRTDTQEKRYSKEIEILQKFQLELEVTIDQIEEGKLPANPEKEHALWEAVNGCYWSIEALRGHTLDLKLFEEKRLTMYAFISHTAGRIRESPETFKDCKDAAAPVAQVMGPYGQVVKILAEIEMRELTLGNKKWSREDEIIFSREIKKALDTSVKEEKK